MHACSTTGHFIKMIPLVKGDLTRLNDRNNHSWNAMKLEKNTFLLAGSIKLPELSLFLEQHSTVRSSEAAFKTASSLSFLPYISVKSRRITFKTARALSSLY